MHYNDESNNFLAMYKVDKYRHLFLNCDYSISYKQKELVSYTLDIYMYMVCRGSVWNILF